MQQPLALNTTTAFPLAIRATRSYTAIAASADGAAAGDAAAGSAATPLPDSGATSMRIIFVVGWSAGLACC